MLSLNRIAGRSAMKALAPGAARAAFPRATRLFSRSPYNRSAVSGEDSSNKVEGGEKASNVEGGQKASKVEGDEKASKAKPKRTSASTRRWPKYDLDTTASRFVHDLKSSFGGPITVAWTDAHFYVLDNPEKGPRSLKPSALRDSCSCAKCKDPVSGQKTFSSTEIPTNIGIASVRCTDEGPAITFSNDIKRLEQDGHETILPWKSVEMALKRRDPADEPGMPRKMGVQKRTGVKFWDRDVLAESVRTIDFNEYMKGGEAFWDSVIDICRLGIVFLKNVPRDEQSVVDITTRIGAIRETFYGRTFDVRAKENAENVAYTNHSLGLHQDLQYLDPVPMIQVLHCLDNTAAGGESLFSDGERVGRLLSAFTSHSRKLAKLSEHLVPFQYDKNGFKYFSSHSVIEQSNKFFKAVHWSPPFQGPYFSAVRDLRSWIEAARVFEQLINAEDAVYKRKLEPGECVIFDNTRVMHGRTAFDTEGDVSRWLRGAYVSSDDFMSTASRIPEGQAEASRAGKPWTKAMSDAALRKSQWYNGVLEMVQKLDPNMVLPSNKPTKDLESPEQKQDQESVEQQQDPEAVEQKEDPEAVEQQQDPESVEVEQKDTEAVEQK